jgi:hypothetical protein
VTSTNGAAAAVAPARTPTPVAAPQSQGNAIKWVLGLLLFIVVCWAVWQLSLHSFETHTAASPTSQQQPLVQQHKQSTGNVAFTVNAQGANNYKFTVPAGAFNVTLKGHFAATGGSGNDIEVFVVSQDEYVNWQNGHPAKTFYNSGRVTQDSINLIMPSDAATYYVVFSNKFSLLTPKAVQANVDLNSYTK